MAAHLGLDCPGCGTTRALFDLARGDVASAFDHNLFAMTAIPFVLAAIVFWFAPRSRPAWVARVAAAPATPRAVLVGVVAFTILRNTALFGGYLSSA